MELSDIAHIQTVSNNERYGNFIFAMGAHHDHDSGHSFTITKERVELQFDTQEQVLEYVLGKIHEECEQVENDQQSLSVASVKIANDTRRACGERVENILRYLGASVYDAGILVGLNENHTRYGVYFNPNWQNYYKVVKS